MLAGHVGLGYGTLFDRDKRLAGTAVEEEDHSHLGSDGDGRGSAAPSEEHRLGGYVVVPEVVMYHLKCPDFPAGGSVEGDDGVGVTVVTGAHPSVVVG
jgi:hypothetical protein